MVSIYNNGSNRKRGSTGWELYWIRHSGWSSFESRNLIITARKSFWHGLVWHLALLNCPRSLGCQPCHFLFAEGSVKIPADRNRADSFLFIKKKSDEWIPQNICGGSCIDIKHIGDVWITSRCFLEPWDTTADWLRNRDRSKRSLKEALCVNIIISALLSLGVDRRPTGARRERGEAWDQKPETLTSTQIWEDSFKERNFRSNLH